MTQRGEAATLTRLQKVLAGLFLVIVCLIAAAQLLRADLLTAQQAFQQRGDRLTLALIDRLNVEQSLLSALAGLHQAQLDLSDDEFAAAARRLLSGYPFMRLLSRVERVDRASGAAFERRMHEHGFPNFRIHAGDSIGRSADAEDNPGNDFLVTKVVEPLTPRTARLLGLDLNALPRLRETIQQAIRDGRTHSCHTLELPDGGRAVALFKALYKGRVLPQDDAQRQRQFAGLLVLYNDPAQLLGTLTDDDPRLSLTLELTNCSSATDDDVVYQRDATARGPIGDWFPFRYERRFERAGNEFRVTARWYPDISVINMELLVPLVWITALLGLASIFVWQNRRITRVREQRARDALAAEKERAVVTLQSIGDGVVRSGPDGRIEMLNPAAARLIGIDADDALGRPLGKVLSIVSDDSRDPPGGSSESSRYALLLRPDGESVAIDETHAPLRDDAGRVSGAVLVFRDVGVERRLHCQLAYQATHDALTDLINRQEFERLVQQAVTNARHEAGHHALFYMDLDQFKVVNDTCGHAAGDLLLKQVSGLLQQHIRQGDTLARLGGDEFGVLLRDCPLDRATLIADSMRCEIRDYRFHWQEQTFDIRVSIGVVSIDADTTDLTELLSSADSACYVAKDRGRDLVHVSQPDDRALALRHGEMQWLQRLQNALQEGRLELLCQRMLRLDEACPKQEIIEFLLRMRSPGGELVSPMAFLPAAERYNMMADIDRWVVDRALAEITAAYHSSGPTTPTRLYTINLSGQSLGDPGTTEYILDRLEHSTVPPQDLCFEITETSAIANLGEATHLMKELKKRGCAFALDDFGSGLSSFGYLKKLPVDYLKIDGAFVRDMVTDPVDAAMVESINNIGRVLQIHTIAEFVEDQPTLDKLRDIGVDYAQGYHIHRPSKLEDAI